MNQQRAHADAEAAREDAEAAREDAEAEAARLARIVELGRKARRGTASADELAELDRLDPWPAQ